MDIGTQIDNLQKKHDEYIAKLRKIWTEIGYDPQVVASRRKIAEAGFDKILLEACSRYVSMGDEMVTEEIHRREKLLETVQATGDEVLRLWNELGMDIKEPDEGLTILQLEKEMRTHLCDARRVRQERMVFFKNLRDSERRLCERMSITPLAMSNIELPNSETLEALKHNVVTLEKELTRRTEILNKCKMDLSQLLTELETEPKGEFQKSVFSDGFILSGENLKSLDNLTSEFRRKLADNADLADEMRAKISSLWQLLTRDPKTLETFMATHRGSKPSVLTALKQQLDSCIKEKMSNMSTYIESLRAQIASLWDACLQGSGPREAFDCYMNCDELDDELLQIHDEECDKWKVYYQERAKLLETLGQYQKTFEEMKVLEAAANNKTRLHNRGGTLLQEEKHRRKVDKNLEKLENTLRAMIGDWERGTGRTFEVFDVPALQYIDDMHAQYHEEKENEKQQRQLAKREQTAKDALLGTILKATPMKRGLPSSTSTTPANVMTKVRKLMQVYNPSGRNPMVPVQTKTRAVTTAKNKRKSLQKNNPRLAAKGGDVNRKIATAGVLPSGTQSLSDMSQGCSFDFKLKGPDGKANYNDIFLAVPDNNNGNLKAMLDFNLTPINMVHGPLNSTRLSNAPSATVSPPQSLGLSPIEHASVGTQIVQCATRKLRT